MTTETLGPLEAFLQDPTVWAIMVNGPDKIFVSREAFRIESTDARFDSEAHLTGIISRILNMIGLSLTPATPLIDAELPDGTRVHAAMRPVVVGGPTLTLTKAALPASQMPTWEVLLKAGSVSPQILQFLEGAVKSRLNIMVCGGAGSGKTTLLNLLALWMAPQSRLIALESDFYLHLPFDNVIRLHPRHPQPDGTGGLSLYQIAQTLPHMRPDRLILAEARGPEALPFLDTVGDGVPGAVFTIHAKHTRDALSRLEIMLTTADPTLPLIGIRQKMVSAVDLIVEIELMPDGWRRIVRVQEVVGMVGDTIQTADIFTFDQTGKDETGKIAGVYRPAGMVPAAAQRIRAMGHALPDDLFMATA